MKLKLILTFYCLISITVQPKNFDIGNETKQKVEQLINSMTLQEKTAQLKFISFDLIKSYINEYGEINTDSLKKYYPHGFGGINVNFSLSPEMYVVVVNSITRYHKTTRLKIPPLFIGEGLHGFMSKKATVFPQAIALGCSWDTLLLEKIYSAVALEASVRGVKLLLSPVVDLGRDPRFGRIEETFSEDPYLAGACGRAAVYGYQGRTEFPDSSHVGATLKHFIGHGIPEGGRNTAPVNISNYDLVNDHLMPFAMCIKARAMAVMPSYNEINGIPNHGNKWLLRNLLRGNLNFNGLVVADQNAIDQMFSIHKVVDNIAQAAKLAIESGIDVDMQYFYGAFNKLDELVMSGNLDEKIIDEAVKRVLSLKLNLGLFEFKTIDIKKVNSNTNNAAHKNLALEAAEKSLVLLKNKGLILPIDEKKIKTIAVIGPNAKGVHLGGYTVEPVNGISVLEGIQKYVQGRIKVLYAEGCKIAKEEPAFWKDDVQTPNEWQSDSILIAEAVEIAYKSDIIILAIGENVSFCREAWGENHLGDRDDLNLLGRQNILVEALLQTGKPIVALIFGGRPLSFNLVAEKVPAIFQVFYPGQEGGTAIANVLFGKTNPSGKLSVTIPKSVGQLPCYYSRKPSRSRSYIYHKGSLPLYPFGFGLSYTSYEYSKPSVKNDTIHIGDSIIVNVNIKNKGKREGEEIVQLYISDEVSSNIRPVMELRDFSKIFLKPGEKKCITFTIKSDKLMYYNNKIEKILEPGKFKILIGPNSVELQSVDIYVIQ